jgi:hypothetical protein
MGCMSAAGCLWGPIYSSVGPTYQICAPASHPDIFMSDVSLMNVTGYIRRFHVTNEYTVIFVGADE